MSEKSIYQKIFDALDIAILAETGLTLNWREAVELRGYIKSLEEAYSLEGNDYRAEIDRLQAELKVTQERCDRYEENMARHGLVPVAGAPESEG